MKRLFVLFICLCSIVSLSIFTGCGVAGSTVVTDIKFTQEIYYVDVGVETYLDYKVYPSSAKNYAEFFNLNVDGNDYTQGGLYNFKDGWITVNDSSFDQLTIEVRINEYTDKAVVKLRQYPDSIFFADADTEAEEKIFEGAYKNLQLKAQSGDDIRYLENAEYNYEVISSDPSVIQIVDEQSLLVKSTGRTGESEITVKILNSAGTKKQGLEAKIKLSVEENISDAYVTVGDKVVNDGNNYSHIISEDLDEIKVQYFSKSGLKIDNNVFYVASSNSSVIEVVAEDEKISLNYKAVGSATITILSDSIKSDGKPYKLSFTVNVTQNT